MSDTAPDTATTARWPDLTHRTQAEVMADEANMDQVFAAIRAERCRQIEAGHTPAADDERVDEELIDSAIWYIDTASQLMQGKTPSEVATYWCTKAGIAGPADLSLQPDPDPIANLTRACALLVAEIERQRRAAMRPVSATTPHIAGGD